MARRIPKLGRHKATGQGVARFDGRDIYFGKWPEGSASAPREVRDAYERHLSEWLRDRQEAEAGTPTPRGLRNVISVAELWIRYHKHAQAYYRHQETGRETSEVSALVSAIGIVVRCRGETLVKAFTPQDLEACRAAMIKAGWTRTGINKQLERVRRMFRWGVSQGLVDEPVYRALTTLDPLRKGRTSAREGTPKTSVEWEVIAKLVAVLRGSLPDLVRVHWLLGCRAEEIVGMTPREVDRADPERWRFRPGHWKTAHLGGPQLTHEIGPEAKAILERRITLARGDDAPVFPNGRGNPYDTHSYAVELKRAARAHQLERITPIQIRKSRLTAIRKAYGLEAAQAVPQHRHAKVTERYAERNQELARKVMDETG